MTRVDSSVPFVHLDPDRSWITDPDPDHPKGTHPERREKTKCNIVSFLSVTFEINDVVYNLL